jgi:hypothetical protein
MRPDRAGERAGVQDELELGEPAAMTEASVTDALHARYSQVHGGNGRRYAVAAGVRSHAGFDARRTCDYVAMDLWPSKGLALHGHEIKISRSDWLRELAEPEKAAEFIPYMTYWWAVASGPRIVRDGELPDGWGLMVVRGGLVTVATAAPKRDAKPMERTRIAALLRAVAQTAAYLERREAQARGTQDGATAGDLRAALAKTQGELIAAQIRADHARDEIAAWKTAFATAGGEIPCRHCGHAIVPRFRHGQLLTEWRHRASASNAPCAAIRAGISRWDGGEIGPADDIDREDD